MSGFDTAKTKDTGSAVHSGETKTTLKNLEK